MTVWIEVDLCNGCGRCLKACPYDAVDMQEGKARILDRCTSCGACLEICKQAAILTDAEERVIPDFSDRKGVWVFAEQRDGKLSRVTLELLGKARDLADTLEENVSALLLGKEVSGLGARLIRYGADEVYLAEHPSLEHYRPLPYTRVMEELVRAHHLPVEDVQNESGELLR